MKIRISRTHKLLASILLGIAFTAVFSCEQPLIRNDLEAIKARGELRVITRNDAICYYEGPHGFTGFEYELSRAFAKYLGVKLKLVVIDNYQDMVLTLFRGDADLIAAGFSAADHHKQRLAFGPGYLKVHQQVVGRRDGPDPKSVKDLKGQLLWVRAGTSHEEALMKLKDEYPELSWKAVSEYETEQLLELTSQGAIPLTVAYSDIIAVNQRYYPELSIHFNLGKAQNLSWGMHPQNRQLQTAVYQWFGAPSTTALVKRLSQNYFEQMEAFDYVDLMRYRRRIIERLPRYQKLFEDAANKHGLDWKVLAAQAYQESHWNPRAKSFTGVRGLMMLTLETAKVLKVKNRLDPKQSVSAGARYMARLRERIGNAVPEPDRTFMALAAYNVGWGHLEDARTLALRLDKDPNTWHGVRSTLPFLRLKRYYRTLSHGYARGNEPVRYVDRIRTYYKILAQNVERSQQNNGNGSQRSSNKPSDSN
jgi:membrane-bound lytic murein transglycosylase F